VVKKDSTRETFSRNKVLRGIRRACKKRPVSTDQMNAMVDALEHELRELGVQEISSSYIGERIMESLRPVDEVAYVRFASVYRSFQNAAEFLDELQHLRRSQEEET